MKEEPEFSIAYLRCGVCGAGITSNHNGIFCPECNKELTKPLPHSGGEERLWTDKEVTTLVGNWMGELLCTHLKDNLKGKVNLTELSHKFQEYKSKTGNNQ